MEKINKKIKDIHYVGAIMALKFIKDTNYILAGKLWLL